MQERGAHVLVDARAAAVAVAVSIGGRRGGGVVVIVLTAASTIAVLVAMPMAVIVFMAAAAVLVMMPAKFNVARKACVCAEGIVGEELGGTRGVRRGRCFGAVAVAITVSVRVPLQRT